MTTISWAASSQVALTPGLRRTARHIALASTSSGVTLTSRNSLSFLSRSTSSIVALTSTVTHSVTWGAVKADATMAWAVILRTPLTGTRVSRSASSPIRPQRDAAGTMSSDAVAPAPEAAASTSARVTVPPSPVGVTLPRSMPRSLASLRTGGLASARARSPVRVSPSASSSTGSTATSVPFADRSGASTLAGSEPDRGRRLASVCLTP